jgi:putative phage-type endonuclease
MITEQQRKERLLGIGGSDMPIIMGLSSYKTPYQLYLEKIGEAETSNEMTNPQYWGSKLEGIIRDEFAERNKVTVETPETIVHPFSDFLRANIDGYIPEWNAILEVKCASSFMAHEWGEDGSDVIPMQYLVQVAHYCAVTNADCAYIAVLIGGNDYREFKYIRDMDIERKVIDEATKFWQRVQDRNPPDAVNQVDLRLMFPKHDPEKTKTIDTPVAEQLTQLSETRFKIKALTEVEEKYRFNIMQFMQDAECLVDGQGKPIISWKANKRGTRTFLMKGA